MSGGRDDDHDVLGVYVAATLGYVRRACGEAGIARVLDLAGEREADLPRADGWIALERMVAIADAAAEVVGTPDVGRLVGEELFAMNAAVGVDEVIRSTGGVAEALRMLTAHGSRMAGGWTLEVVGTGDHVVEIESSAAVDATTPFFCGVGVGYWGRVPAVFGMADATVVHPECTVRGDARCRYVVRWADGERLRGRSFDVVANIERLQAIGARLAGADDVDRVVELAAALAPEVVDARRFLIRARVGDDRSVVAHHGFDGRIDAIDELLARIESQVTFAPAGAADQPVLCVVPLATGRSDLGWLAAVHPPRSTIDESVRRPLASFARHVASALDAAITLETARRDRDTATSLVELAHELVGATTAEQVVVAVERALPGATGCVGAAVSVFAEPAPRTDWRDEVRSVTTHTLVARGAIVGSVSVGWATDDPPGPLVLERLDAITDQAAQALDVVRLLADLHHQARHDPLSGLPNRALLAERAESAITRARAGPHHVGLLFVDLDRFKRINDDLGHAAGDEVICQVADRLRAVVRGGDTVARLGGDEFVVLLAECEGVAEAAAVAERVRAAMREPFVVDGEPREVSATIGVHASDAGDLTWHELLDRADAAMYRGKQTGRDAVAV